MQVSGTEIIITRLHCEQMGPPTDDDDEEEEGDNDNNINTHNNIETNIEPYIFF